MIPPTEHRENQPSQIRLNQGTREIFSGQLSVKLTNKEFDIFQTLVSKPGRVIEREALLEKIWGPDVHVSGRTVDAHMVKVRRNMKLLGNDTPTIETVWALGYRLIDPSIYREYLYIRILWIEP